MLMRSEPFRELDRLTQQAFGTRARPAMMPMDAYREGDHYVVHFDLPGIDPSSIDLTVEKNVLTVRADRSWRPEEGDEVVVAERPRGTSTRQLFLGDTLDVDRLEAHYDQGVLTLTIPTAEAAKARRVEVSVGGGASGSTAIDASSRPGGLQEHNAA